MYYSIHRLGEVRLGEQTQDQHSSAPTYCSFRFNDKRDSLADARLAKIHGLKNQFQDQRVTGIESYDKAKADMASDTWEKEVKGVEMIVSIARTKPEVSRSPLTFK